MLIVGLSGRKGAAKNTIADAIATAMGNDGLYVEQYGFAHTLKEICREIFGLTWVQCYGSEADKRTYSAVRWEDVLAVQGKEDVDIDYYFDGHEHLTAREVLQVFGSDIVRRMAPDAWVRATLARISSDSPDIALITDVRFPNEVEGIRQAGGKVIRLTRAPFDDGHISERALDGYHGFDVILTNDTMTLQEQAKVAIDLVFSWL